MQNLTSRALYRTENNPHQNTSSGPDSGEGVSSDSALRCTEASMSKSNESVAESVNGCTVSIRYTQGGRKNLLGKSALCNQLCCDLLIMPCRKPPMPPPAPPSRRPPRRELNTPPLSPNKPPSKEPIPAPAAIRTTSWIRRPPSSGFRPRRIRPLAGTMTWRYR